jgi:hypothetical protein
MTTCKSRIREAVFYEGIRMRIRVQERVFDDEAKKMENPEYRALSWKARYYSVLAGLENDAQSMRRCYPHIAAIIDAESARLKPNECLYCKGYSAAQESTQAQANKPCTCEKPCGAGGCGYYDRPCPYCES